jgi:monofunctional glycosyltransferase
MGWLLRTLARVVVGFVAVSLVAVVVYRFVDPPITPLMVARMVETVAARKPIVFERRWVNLGAVSPTLVRSVLAAEDSRFLDHHGVDLDALRRAWAYNARWKGRRLRGAGTVTMQAARNVFLWQGRSYLRKGLEVYFATLIDALWGKRRVLEVYLNVIEWGDGVYGVEAAARRYFGVPASRLGPREAALLAAALPAPRRSNPATPSRYLANRATIIAVRAARISLARL